jgi:hypothetical protein
MIAAIQPGRTDALRYAETTPAAVRDAGFEAAALRALAANPRVPPGRIRIQVRDGWITVEGEVDWLYERFAASDAVSHLPGVAGCRNHVSVRPSHAGCGENLDGAGPAGPRNTGHGIDPLRAEPGGGAA